MEHLFFCFLQHHAADSQCACVSLLQIKCGGVVMVNQGSDRRTLIHAQFQGQFEQKWSREAEGFHFLFPLICMQSDYMYSAYPWVGSVCQCLQVSAARQ